MKILKKIIVLFAIFFISLSLFYIIFPKGYLLLTLSENLGIKAYPQKIEEGFFKTRFYQVKVYLPSKLENILNELSFSQIDFTGFSLFIPCQKGYLKAFYTPWKSFKIVLKDFYGSCAGKKELGVFYGKVKFIYDKGFFGKIHIKNSQFFSSGQIEFKGKRACLRAKHFSQCFIIYSQNFSKNSSH